MTNPSLSSSSLFAPIDHIVLDVEIAHTIEETPGGWDSTHLLGVAVACVWEYRTGRMRVYGPGENDLVALKERILKADRVSGYNIWMFDFPVIWGYSRDEWVKEMLWSREKENEEKWGQMENRGRWAQQKELQEKLLPKTNDILRRIWGEGLGLDPDHYDDTTHKNWGLNIVAKGTLGGAGKIGYGGDAPKWFKEGDWAKVVNYCADDVALERDLVDFVDRWGYVVNGGTGQVVPMRKLVVGERE
jgi:hypothetical protein